MIRSAVFKRFEEKSPVLVMSRSLMERILNPQWLDEWFNKIAEKQYTRHLLFSSMFDIMSQVVCGVQVSVNAAFQSMEEEIGVSLKSVYNKLNGIELNTSAELVRYSASEAASLIKELGGMAPDLLPGYQVKLLDGNCIEASDKRIKALRPLKSGALPGKSLVVLDPALRIVIDVFPCEDGHAQERSLLPDVLETVAPGDVWICDRNFCTNGFLSGIINRESHFIIREHANLPLEEITFKKLVGSSETGKVYEQSVKIIDEHGNEVILRRVTVRLKDKTRDGDKEINILTNLPKRIRAKKIAKLYRDRWKIEIAFQELTTHLNSEINTLGYPQAALFGFCVALVTYNVFAVIKATIQNVHGVDVAENNISGYYLANEISTASRGMSIAIPDKEWECFRTITALQMVNFLVQLAQLMKLRKYKKHKRGPKKPMKKNPGHHPPHVSTAKLLAGKKK